MRGIKVSKPGISTDSEDPRDFTIHSQYNIFKIAQEGTGTTDFGTGYEYDKSITHNLGYKPQVFLFFEHPEIKKWACVPANFVYDEGGGLESGVSGTAFHENNNTIILRFASSANVARDVKYKYYIMIEPREDAWYE